MQHRSTFTLDEEVAQFLLTKENKSAYINTLIKKEISQELEAAILKANIEEAEDAKYLQELSEWDNTLNDGEIG